MDRKGAGGERSFPLVGIDVSKATLSVALLDPITRSLRWERSFPNTITGVREILRRTPFDVPWVLEPTGAYSLSVAKQARAAERRVLLAPPRKAKAFLASLQDRAKTDRLDSRGLARYGLAVPLRPYPIKSEAMEEVDQLLAARRGLTQALASLGQQRKALPAAADALQPALTALQTQRDALDRQIAKLVATSPVAPLATTLRRVPGIGPVTSAAVATCLQEKAFSHPDAVVAHVGLDVQVRDSGRRVGKRALSKRGNPELRRLLFLAAASNVRSKSSPFKAQYQRELAKGLPKTAALCAVARKIARTCWSLARHNTQFDPTRIYRQ
jgi:transposase